MSEKRYVLYHANCPDGFCSAYVFWTKYKDQAEYVPCSYNKPLPDIEDGATVFMVDFSVSREETEALAARTKLTVLDHHKTAEKELTGLPYAVFDMKKSGASLAWDYLYSNLPAPELVRYIEDRDLWQWKLKDSREISTVISLLPNDFQEWDHIKKLLDNDAWRLSVVHQGELLLKQQKTVVDRQVSQSFVDNTPFGKAAFASTMAYQSETGEALLAKYPEAAFSCCFVIHPATIRCSLRSRGDFDVSVIAKYYGGGGHAAAAGMFIDPPYNRFFNCFGGNFDNQELADVRG